MSKGFNSGLSEQATERFQGLLRTFQASSAEEIEGAAREETEKVRAFPTGERDVVRLRRSPLRWREPIQRAAETAVSRSR